MAGNPHDRGLSAFSARRGSAADDPVVKEKIARIQKDLDIERQRCNTMYLSYLPKEAVDLVHRGLIPSGGMFIDLVITRILLQGKGIHKFVSGEVLN